MSDWIILFLAIFLFIVSVRLTIVQAELLKVENPDLDPESKPEPEPDKKEPSPGNDGDWMVELKKPRREIMVTGCDTEGEVVRKIILMNHRSEDIRDIIRL